MKREFVRAALQPANRMELEQLVEKPGGCEVYLPLLRLLADCLDLAAKGEDVWVNFGMTRNRDAALVSVHDGNNKYTAGGETLVQVAIDCERLL